MGIESPNQIEMNLPDFLLAFVLRHPVLTQVGIYSLAACIQITASVIIYSGTSHRFRIGRKNNSEDQNGIKEEEQQIKPTVKSDRRISSHYRRWAVAALLVFTVIVLTSVYLLLIRRSGTVSENPSLTASKYTFGLDVSSYQKRINWDQVIGSHHPIKFVFIRSTMGVNGKDSQFQRNWKLAKENGLLRGAYHYYRPDENPAQQFRNFASTVKIKKGDMPPVLDVEALGLNTPQEIRRGINERLSMAEAEYSMKPILYIYRKFYNSYLRGHVRGYPLWIAFYSGKHKLVGIDWTFHQFTSMVRIKGITTRVDGNDFRGTFTELVEMCKKTNH